MASNLDTVEVVGSRAAKVRTGRRDFSSLRYLVGGLGITLIAGLGAGACAESQPPEILDTPPGSVEIPTMCNGSADATQCGDGCCNAGFACTMFGRCISSDPCGEGQPCSSDSVCITRGDENRCLPWDTLPQAARFSRTCRTNIDLPSVIPEVQCQWPGETTPSDFPEHVQVIGTPMVVDFNFDENPTTLDPSIVFISYDGQYSAANGVLRVINGKNCTLQATIAGGLNDEGIFRSQVSPALGDMDGDGRAEIVVADQTRVAGALRSGVAIYKWSGTGTEFDLLARATSSSSAAINGLSLHDLNDDGPPEILTQNTILQLNGNTLLGVANEGDTVRAAALEPPIVCDVEGNGGAELVTARGLFNWDAEGREIVPKLRDGGGEVWPATNTQDAAQFVALADLGDFTVSNLGGNDSVEMVAVGFAGELWVKLMDGNTVLRVEGTNGAGGPPVIADFDGDGRMEFASPGRDELTVFDLDCVTGREAEGDCANPDGPNREGVVWASRIQGAQSGVAVFDFDGDRKAEVVYADQCFMRVYDGESGEVLFSVARSSITQWEYPVVADVDGDRKSELITTSNDNNGSLDCDDFDPQNENQEVAFEPTHGVTVWRDPEDGWAGSRPIWNQHDYFVTNVNDDGTIPQMLSVKSHWNENRNPERTNTFRQNVQGATGQSLEEPDITTSGNPEVDCADNGRSATFSVDVCNRGLRTLGVGEANVTLVMTENASRQLCNPSNTAPLAAGSCVSLSCTAPVPAVPFNVTIMGDYSGEVAECDEDNNLSSIANVFCGGIID